MSILDKQYGEITDSAQRIEFRVELGKLIKDNSRMISELTRQNEESLKKLVTSLEGIVYQTSGREKKTYEMILSNVKVVLRKQQDVPVALDVLISGLGDAGNRCIKIAKNDDQPYFTLSFYRAFDQALGSTMRDVFAPYEYLDEEDFARAGMINISKVSIQGKESDVGTVLSQSIVNKKAEIIASLKEAMSRQQKRCQSDPTRENDPKLQQLSNQIPQKLKDLDALARDPRVGVVEILDVINSTSDFTKGVDEAIEQFKQDVLKLKSAAVFRERLAKVVKGSSSPSQRPQHEYSNNEIGMLLIITPFSKESSFVSLRVYSESQIVNRIIQDSYRVCESADAETSRMARGGNMMFIDKKLLQESGDLNHQIKDKFFLNKEELVAELKKAINVSRNRCSSDEQRLLSPELDQLRQQGNDKLSQLDKKLSSPEQLIQLIEETETYRQTVSSAIEIFKEASSSARFGP